MPSWIIWGIQDMFNIDDIVFARVSGFVGFIFQVQACEIALTISRILESVYLVMFSKEDKNEAILKKVLIYAQCIFLVGIVVNFGSLMVMLLQSSTLLPYRHGISVKLYTLLKCEPFFTQKKHVNLCVLSRHKQR